MARVWDGMPFNETGLAVGLPHVLEAEWGVRGYALSPSMGPVGMGSVTLGVELPGRGSFVAKWVRASSAGALDRGSAIALELERAGMSTGAPLPTRAGALSAALSGGRVALLRQVAGRPLTGRTSTEQELMARALARVHAARRPSWRSDPYLVESLVAATDVEPWVVSSVRAVLDEYAALPPLAWGLVHHDPAPEAFFHDDESRTTGLIDWTGAGEGPLLYDIASALMYLGGLDAGHAFLDAYLGLAPHGVRAEVTLYLPALLRFRGGVQAAYFATRLARGDLTGITAQADNLTGLHDARRMLIDEGVAEAVHE